MSNKKDHLADFVKQNRRRRRARLVSRYLRLSIGVIVFLFLGLWLVLQNENVQNWAATKATTYLSDRLQTKVSLKKFDLEFFDQLLLEDFYIEDHNGDTLIYSKTLSTSLSANLLALMRKDVDVDVIKLRQARIYISRDSTSAKSNLQEIFERLSPKYRSKIQLPILQRHQGVIFFWT